MKMPHIILIIFKLAHVNTEEDILSINLYAKSPQPIKILLLVLYLMFFLSFFIITVTGSLKVLAVYDKLKKEFLKKSLKNVSKIPQFPCLGCTASISFFFFLIGSLYRLSTNFWLSVGEPKTAG